MTELETFEHQTGPEPTAAVIWLHGLGADAHDFEPVVPLLDLGPERALRYVFPNAPVRPVTINAGMACRAWYDISQLEPGHIEDDAGIRETASAIAALVGREVERGIPTRRIVLAGFSQGGAAALYTALRYPEPLCAVLALSCYLPMPGSLATEQSAANQSVPIFMAHGQADNVLPYWVGQASRDQLLQAGYTVTWKSYAMMHSVVPEELADIRDFLDRHIPKP